MVNLVIGVDPSLTATGIVDQFGMHETIKYHKGVDDSYENGDRRLAVIANTLDQIFFSYDTLEDQMYAVIEDLPTHAYGAGKTGMVQGVVRLILHRHSIAYVPIVGSSLKKFATGKGTASKADMRMELFKRTGLDLDDNNQVDAIWLREMGLHLLGAPMIKLPQTHLVALEAVRDWIRP